MSNTTPYRPRVIESVAARAEREAAVARGYADGLESGRAEAAAELDQLMQAQEARFGERTAALESMYAAATATLGAAAHALHTGLAEKVGDAHSRVQHTALEIAVSVIGAELSSESNRVRAAIDRVLATVEFDEITSIRMHPADVEALAAMAPVPHITAIADDTLQPGDAYAVLVDGWLDARIDSALARVRASLRDQVSTSDALIVDTEAAEVPQA